MREQRMNVATLQLLCGALSIFNTMARDFNSFCFETKDNDSIFSLHDNIIGAWESSSNRQDYWPFGGVGVHADMSRVKEHLIKQCGSQIVTSGSEVECPDYFTSSNHYCPVKGEDNTASYGGVIRHTFRAIDHSKALECVTDAMNNLDCSDALTVSRFDPDLAFLLGVPAAMILVICCCCICGQSKQEPAARSNSRTPLLSNDSPINSSPDNRVIPDPEEGDQERDVETGDFENGNPMLSNDSPINSSPDIRVILNADESDQESDLENGNAKGPDYESCTDSDDERKVISQQP